MHKLLILHLDDNVVLTNLTCFYFVKYILITDLQLCNYSYLFLLFKWQIILLQYLVAFPHPTKAIKYIYFW